MKIEHVIFFQNSVSFSVCSHDQIFGTNKNRILKNGSCERAIFRVKEEKISYLTMFVFKFILLALFSNQAFLVQFELFQSFCIYIYIYIFDKNFNNRYFITLEITLIHTVDIEDNKYYLNNIMEKVIPKSKAKFLQNFF